MRNQGWDGGPSLPEDLESVLLVVLEQNRHPTLFHRSYRGCNQSGVATEPPNGFLDFLMDLMVQINTVPSRTPITVEWNQHLPFYDSTCVHQKFKEFTCLFHDLPFKYGSHRLTLIIPVLTWIRRYTCFPWSWTGILPFYRRMSRKDGMTKPDSQMVSTDYPQRSSLGHIWTRSERTLWSSRMWLCILCLRGTWCSSVTLLP